MSASLDNTFVVSFESCTGFYLLGNTKEQNCQAVFFCTMQEDGDWCFYCTFFKRKKLKFSIFSHRKLSHSFRKIGI